MRSLAKDEDARERGGAPRDCNGVAPVKWDGQGSKNLLTEPPKKTNSPYITLIRKNVFLFCWGS